MREENGLGKLSGEQPTDVGGTAEMLEVARLHGLGRLVFCASTSTHGPTMPLPRSAASPIAPGPVETDMLMKLIWGSAG